jgi:hypothetical protein
LSPWIAMWLPMGLLSAFAIWRFWQASFRIGGEGLDNIFGPISNAVQSIVTRLRRRIGLGEGQ